MNSSDTGRSFSSHVDGSLSKSTNSSTGNGGGRSEQTQPNNDASEDKCQLFKKELIANWRKIDDLRGSRSTGGLPMGYLEAKLTSIKDNEAIVIRYLGSATDTAAEVMMKEVRSAWDTAWRKLSEVTTGDKLFALLNYVQTALEEQVLFISTNEVF